MRKRSGWRTTFVIAGFLFLVACASRKSEPIKQEVFTALDDQVAEGEKVYMAFCQKCHPAGEAGLGPSINANPAPQFIKRFQVRLGLGEMPAFDSRVISKNDLKNLSQYMKRWDKR